MTRPKRTLATCCAAHTLHDGLSDVTYVLLPLLAQTFGLSLAQVGLIRSAHRAAMATFQIPAGIMEERVGERNLLALGTLIAGVAFLALGYAPGFWAILVALFCAGLGSAVQHPLSSTIISHAYPGEGRRAALGTYNFFGDVGKFAFGGAVSLLLIAGVSWEAPVVGFGLCGILTAIAIWFHVTNSHAHGAGTATGRIKPATKVAGWGIRNPQGFTALCLIEILDSSTRTGFLTFIAFLLIAKGLPEGWATLSVPLILVGGMAGKLATLALPGAASFLLLPLIGVVVNGTSSVLYATVGDFVEQDRLPRAFGLFYTLGPPCGAAAPLRHGPIGG